MAHAGLALAMVQYAFYRFVLERGQHPPSLAVLQLVLVFVVAFTLSRIGFVLAVPASLAAATMWVAGGGQDTPRLFGLGAILYVFSCAAGYMSERHVRREFVASRLLDAERAKSDRLLLNVLPAPIAARLKAGEDPIADA